MHSNKNKQVSPVFKELMYNGEIFASCTIQWSRDWNRITRKLRTITRRLSVLTDLHYIRVIIGVENKNCKNIKAWMVSNSPGTWTGVTRTVWFESSLGEQSQTQRFPLEKVHLMSFIQKLLLQVVQASMFLNSSCDSDGRVGSLSIGRSADQSPRSSSLYSEVSNLHVEVLNP